MRNEWTSQSSAFWTKISTVYVSQAYFQIHWNNEWWGVLNSVVLAPSRVSCHCATVPSSVQNFFSWVFRESKIFSRRYFVGPDCFSCVFLSPNFYLWVISWVQNFFSWIFSWVQIFSRGCFVGTSWLYKWEIKINKYRTSAPINTE